MAQDTALLRYLLKWARRAPWSWSQRDLAFAFNWTNGYISSNATIGRTGYDMNVSGNVSTGSDADGSYIWINWNRDSWAATWTAANIYWWTTPLFNQTTSFTISAKVKINNLPTAQTSGIFGSSFDAWFHTDFGWNDIIYWLRWSTTVQNVVTGAVVLWTVFTFHQVYDAVTAKFYGYLNGTLLNVWWTAWPTTFSTNDWYIGDTAITWWTVYSCNKYIYHAAIRNKALTQAEIDADIALWNTAKNDPSIVAYYIPDNLQYNTQYIANPKDLANASWAKLVWCTVAANTTVAPDGTTTADTVTFTAANNSQTSETVTSISWATIASKTFIVKAFVKVAAWTKQFRLKCAHSWVSDYLSTDQTATTTRQEFTFTQTFTSSTSWTWINPWVCNGSGAVAWDIQVRNVRLFLVNETLRDESPNIWWFIWWKTPLVMSAWVKPDIDSADTATKQCFFQLPRHFMQLRTTSNTIQFRSETALTTRTAPTQSLWTWFRGKAHMLFVKYRDWTGRLYKAYVNWTLVSWSQTAYSNTARPAGTIYRTNASIWLYTTDYRSGNIRDIRAYTFTGSFTDADALAIYNGGEPTSSGVTKYLHYRPPVGEVWTTTQDQSTNDRDWTLNNWVTRDYI